MHMKKLFSIVLMAALLVTCISPALYSSATDLPSFVVKSDAEYEETTSAVDVSIGIADNPGISEMTVLVYYLESEMSISGFTGGTAFTDAEQGNSRPSNHRTMAAYFPAEEFGDTVYQVTEFTVYAPTAEDETANGNFLNVTFDLIGAHAAGTEFTYGVKVKSAANAAGDEVTFAGKQEGKLTFTPDPYKAIYENFTIFPTDATIDLEAKEATVDLRLVNNPGVYAFRVFVVYDDALTMTSFTPVEGVFKTQSGTPDTVETGTSNTMTPPDSYGADGILRAIESKNISKDGKLVAQILFMVPNNSEENRLGDGPVARMTFALPENIQQGDSFPIDVCWADTDATAFDIEKDAVVPIGSSIDNATGYIKTAICEHPNVVLETVKEATCTETGLKSGVCPDCNQTVEEEIPMIPHTPGEPEKVPANCTEAGRIITKCTVCGTEISNVEDPDAPVLGHDEENATSRIVKDATCTEVGQREIVCGRCEEVIRTEEIPMIPHTETTGKTPADCTEAGRIITKCTVCGTEISNVEDPDAPALGHKEGAPVVTKPATCTETGSQDIFCERCDVKLRTEEIPMLPHTEKIEKIAPTCTEAGRIVTTCSVCGTEISNVEDADAPALGHTVETEVVEPTCVEAGRIITKCTVCGEIISDEEDADHPATGIHTPGEPEVVEPTATEDGSKTVKCTVCGEVLSVEKIPATGVDTTAPSPDDDTTTKAPAADTTATPANNANNNTTNSNKPVKTGDSMVYIAIVAALAIVGCATVVIIRKRKVSEK